MILNEDVRVCAKEAPFITLVSLSSTGDPYAIGCSSFEAI